MRNDSVIEAVDLLPMRMPFAAPFTMATPLDQKRESIDILVVRIRTASGTVGVGETQAWRRQGSSEYLPNLVRLIRELLVPRLLGRSCLDIAALMHGFEAAVYNSLYAQAAVGDALLDAAARVLGVPLCVLLGGQSRSRIPVGFALGISDSPDRLIAKAEEVYALGYRHMRLKMGMNPDEDVRNAAAMRDRFGAGIHLRADINGSMSLPDAMRLMARLVPFDLDVLEQPVRGSDLEGMAILAEKFPTPISADESLSNIQSLLEICRRRAASVVQLKIGKNGGVYNCRRLWDMADAAGVSVFPGNHPCTSVSTAAMAHLCASRPYLTVVGDFQAGIADILAHDIARNPVAVRDGEVHLPDGPGLGIDLDEVAIERFRVD